MIPATLALTLAGMSVIPRGSFAPLYATNGAERVSVSSFALDTEPVTRGDFLQFVRKNPEWRRSSVTSSRADKGYLSDWTSDLSPGNASDFARPVTSVSRHAAIAYCESKGKRLPTTNEWEYAAAASESNRDAARDKSFIARLIGFYRARSGVRPDVVGKSTKNVYGVRDLHELTWEWTDDPNEHHNHEHHMFCASAAIGAVDPSNYPAFMRYAVRSGLRDRTTLTTLGFRCAAG